MKTDTIDVNILGIFKKVKLFTLFCLTKWCDKKRQCTLRISRLWEKVFLQVLHCKELKQDFILFHHQWNLFFQIWYPGCFQMHFPSRSKTGLEHIWNNVCFSEFAKLRAFCAYVTYVLRTLRIYVPTCLRAVRSYVPLQFTCHRPFIP